MKKKITFKQEDEREKAIHKKENNNKAKGIIWCNSEGKPCKSKGEERRGEGRSRRK